MSSAAIELNQRLLQVTSHVLGQNNFLPLSMQGQSAISSAYEFKIRGTLNNYTQLDIKKLLCTPLSCVLNHQSQAPQYLHGLITCVTHLTAANHFDITVSPWLALLKNTCNCRIYQNQTIPDIVSGLFTELGFTDFDFSKLTHTYPQQAYVTQFNESDFDFVTRCLSVAGIYYYFVFTQDKHTLVAVDSDLKTPLITGVFYNETQTSSGTQITSLHSNSRLNLQALTQSDYNPDTPDDKLVTKTTVSHPRGHPLLTHLKYFQYPGGYSDSNHGQVLSQIKLDALSAEDNFVMGESDCDQLLAGVRFKIKDDDIANSYLITEFSFDVQDPYGFAHQNHHAAGKQKKYYRNRFKAHPLKTLPYRPPQNIAKPHMGGLMTAIVISPANPTIHMDKAGRILVQFHWDRYGQSSHNTAWLRVSHQIASQKAGTFFTPRVGQHVLVSFLGGDLDRPLIVGSVYNNNHKPGYNLPDEKWVTGIKTDSGNELTFNDTPGSENVVLNSTKDYQQTVAGNYQQTIQGNTNTIIEKGDYKISSNSQLKINAHKRIQLKVGDSTLVLTPEGVTINSPTINIITGGAQAVTPGAASSVDEGEHWVQGHYVNAPKGMPYSIHHTDGSVYKGTLNSQGKTDKLTKLSAGMATIQFGDKQKLDQQLKQQRQQLKTYLDSIIQHAQAQAAQDQKLLAKKPWWDKVYIYGKGIVESTVHGAVTVTKSTGHLIVGMFEGAGDVLALTARIEQDTLTGDDQDLEKIYQQANQKTKAILNKLESAYQTLSLIKKDKPTDDMLTGFAEQYYNSMDGLMLLKDIGNIVGGFIPAIILAVITKNPEALGAGVSADVASLVDNAANKIEGIEKTTQQLEKCAIIENASLDDIHVLGPPPEAGAVHVSQVEQLGGYETKHDLDHPSGSKYKLDSDEARNFHSEPKPVILKKGTKIFRVVSNNPNSVNGRWWVSKLPHSMEQWRSEFAVTGWNGNGYYVEHILEEDLPGWQGSASSQFVEDSSGIKNPDWVQKGGGTQMFFSTASSDIPKNLIVKRTGW